jgi:O-antigen ligase
MASQARLSTGKVFFYSIVLTTILAGLGRPDILGFRLCGWMWLIPLAAAILCVALPFRRKVLFPLIAWIPFFIYVVLRTDFGDRADLQRLAIFLTPVMVGVAASCLPIRRLALIRKAYYALFLAATLSYAVARLGFVGWYIPQGACMTLTLLAVAACVDCGRGIRLAYPMLGVCWLICVLTESRMPVLVIPILFILGPTGFSLVKKALFGACVAVLGLVLFYSEPVQSNLFRKGSGTIEDVTSLDPSKLSTGGRLTAWPVFFESIKKNPWFGVGGTASTEFGNESFGGWSHPHNEYIRLLFDYGIVGTVLFFGPIIQLLVRCYQRLRKGSPDVQWLFTVGLGGILAMLLLAITGNVLMYVAWFGNLLFATIGVAFRASATNHGRKAVRSVMKRTNAEHSGMQLPVGFTAKEKSG